MENRLAVRFYAAPDGAWRLRESIFSIARPFGSFSTELGHLINSSVILSAAKP